MATRDFISAFWKISQQTNLISNQFHKVRQLYEIHEIQNKVLDGTVSFPEDSRSLMSGIAIEFRYVLFSFCHFIFRVAEVFDFLVHSRHVSFRYPGSEIFALRDVSFKIGKGQLCVSPTPLTFRVLMHG